MALVASWSKSRYSSPSICHISIGNDRQKRIHARGGSLAGIGLGDARFRQDPADRCHRGDLFPEFASIHALEPNRLRAVVPAGCRQALANPQHQLLGRVSVDSHRCLRGPGVRVQCLVAFGDVAPFDLVVGGPGDAPLPAELPDSEGVWQARVELYDLTAYRRR